MYSLCKCCRNAWSGIIWKQLFGQGTKNMRRTWSTFPCYLARLGAKICQWLHFGTEILHLHSFIGFSKVLIDFLLVFTDLSMVFIVFFLMMFIDVWMVFIFFHVCLFFPNGCHWMFHDFDIFLFDGFEPFFHGVHRCVHRCVHCCSLLVLHTMCILSHGVSHVSLVFINLSMFMDCLMVFIVFTNLFKLSLRLDEVWWGVI